MKLLVIDDSRTMRMLIRDAIKGFLSSPADMSEAKEGEEALRMLASGPGLPDLILADWKMSGMDGLAFLKKVRSQESTKTLPVIMISSQSQSTDKAEAMAAGATDYILKPFEAKMLQERIEALFKKT